MKTKVAAIVAWTAFGGLLLALLRLRHGDEVNVIPITVATQLLEE